MSFDAKYYSSSFSQGKNQYSFKPFPPKKQPPKSNQTQSIFSNSNPKKYIPDQQSSKLILSYFQYNNFQDFNTWQQIAKTKTDYKFEQVEEGDKLQCQLVFKWQAGEKENIILKAIARNKKNAKKKALVQLIETLISKGFIGYGFKEKNFADKLPRRKKYESSSSEQDTNINETNQSRRINVYNALKQNNFQLILNDICQDNILEIWAWALRNKNIDIISKVLIRFFEDSKKEDETIIEENKQTEIYPHLKQVSYVEQSKDPFEEDLTVFIRYYQLQRKKYQQNNFNCFPINKERSIQCGLPSVDLGAKSEKGFKMENFKQFRTIEQIGQFIGKKKSSRVVENGKNKFFSELQEMLIPKFEEDIQQKKFVFIKIIEKMFNLILYTSIDYRFAIKVLQVLQKKLQSVNFFNSSSIKSFENGKKDQNQEQNVSKAQNYYKTMKTNLLKEMLYNLKIKIQKQNLNKSNSIQGMLNFASSHSKYEGIFQFTSKQPQQITSKKIQRKSNLNQFFQQQEFCVQEVILLTNKINQSTYVGIIRQLNQSFKIHVPFLLLESQTDYPAPFIINKLLNNKIYNKLSSSLIHVCKNYMDYVDFLLGGNKNVLLIYQTPSGAHIEVIQELLAEFVVKKLFVLIVSQNYQILAKLVTQKGFKCHKLTVNSDQKIISKNNIIFANHLNVCTQFMKNIAFERVIIDEAHKIPEIISLLSIIKCTKKLYLIGDPNLPRSQMKSPLSKINKIEKSLFEKYLQQNSSYFIFPYSLVMKNSQIQKQQESKIFVSSIVQWLKKSVYNQQIVTDLQIQKRKTPLIKGFNWPSNQYRLCFVNIQIQIAEQQTFSKLISEQCFLILWIIAQVLKSGFTQLQQITCCCLDSSLISILQQNLLKILIKLNIQPLKWQIIFQRLIKPLNGSIWNRNDLVILWGRTRDSSKLQVNHQYFKNNKDTQANKQFGKKLNSALLQAERGLIIVGDLNQLSQKSIQWKNFIDWMALKKLILSYNLQK